MKYYEFGIYAMIVGALGLLFPAPLIKFNRWQMNSIYKKEMMNEKQFKNNIILSRIFGFLTIILGAFLYFKRIDLTFEMATWLLLIFFAILFTYGFFTNKSGS